MENYVKKTLRVKERCTGDRSKLQRRTSAPRIEPNEVRNRLITYIKKVVMRTFVRPRIEAQHPMSFISNVLLNSISRGCIALAVKSTWYSLKDIMTCLMLLSICLNSTVIRYHPVLPSKKYQKMHWIWQSLKKYTLRNSILCKIYSKIYAWKNYTILWNIL